MRGDKTRLWLLGTAILAFSSTAGAQGIPSRSRGAGTVVTFNNQIVRIFQKNCQVCHHPGDIAPFSLMSYSEALPYARSIKQQTLSRQMPPWKPVAGYGEFQNERRLTRNEINLIAHWVDSGAPEGDPGDLPPPLEFPDQWSLGTPDVILESPADFAVPGDGNDIYRCFSLSLGLLQNRHITGIEVRPGNRSVVHHVVLYSDPLAQSSRLAASSDGQPGYTCFGGPGIRNTDLMGGWAPGNQPQTFPAGVGLPVTAGSRVVLQIHYHPEGTPQADRTRVGLFFERGAIQKNLLLAAVINDSFVVPAGVPRYVVTASEVIPRGANFRAIAVLPHMHLLGREIRMEAVYPDGARRPMIYIDDWDFQWQGTYYYKDPVPLPSGARLEVMAVYDNSAENPANPNRPPRDVRFGEQTTDEMCVVLVMLVPE